MNSARMCQNSWWHPKIPLHKVEKMTIRQKTWALALAACMFAAPALADDREGAYVYITGGMGLAQNACSSALIPAGTTCTQRSGVFRAGFGYQYSPMWALEASYGQYGYASSAGYIANVNFPAPTGPSPASFSWQLKATGAVVQAVASVHMTNDFIVFGKAGVAQVVYDEYMHLTAQSNGSSWYLSPTASTTRFNPALGVGIRMDVTPNGSLLLLAESFGQNNIYNVYGQAQKVRLLTASAGLMWRY